MSRYPRFRAPLLLAFALAACGSDPDPVPGGGSVRGADGGAKLDAPALAADAAPPDGPASADGAVPGLGRPMYPPAGMPGTCAPGCMQLRQQYAELVLKAQSCTPGAADACGRKAFGSLGCLGCEVWVNDLGDLAPVFQRFNQMGCFGCFFDGVGGENRCHPIACADLDSPLCRPMASGGGTCLNAPRDRTCGPTVMNGAPCMPPRDDYCMGGSQALCSCFNSRWTCFRAR
jgi:hypothetical protein